MQVIQRESSAVVQSPLLLARRPAQAVKAWRNSNNTSSNSNNYSPSNSSISSSSSHNNSNHNRSSSSRWGNKHTRKRKVKRQAAPSFSQSTTATVQVKGTLVYTRWPRCQLSSTTSNTSRLCKSKAC